MDEKFVDTFLGHPIAYWAELEKRARQLNANDLLQEVVELRGKLDFCKSRIEQICQKII